MVLRVHVKAMYVMVNLPWDKCSDLNLERKHMRDHFGLRVEALCRGEVLVDDAHTTRRLESTSNSLSFRWHCIRLLHAMFEFPVGMHVQLPIMWLKMGLCYTRYVSIEFHEYSVVSLFPKSLWAIFRDVCYRTTCSTCPERVHATCCGAGNKSIMLSQAEMGINERRAYMTIFATINDTAHHLNGTSYLVTHTAHPQPTA